MKAGGKHFQKGQVELGKCSKFSKNRNPTRKIPKMKFGSAAAVFKRDL